MADERRLKMKVKLIEALLSSHFAQIQNVYDISLKIDSKSVEERFVSSSANMSMIRTEFITRLEELNMVQMEANQEFEPSFKRLEAFDSLYSHIQSTLNDLNIKSSKTREELKPKCPKMKIPPMELQKFDGSNPKSWPLFIECYNNTIHNNGQLSPAEKVYYLCGQLSGKALESISSISPTGANYDLIYSALVQRYQDIRGLGIDYLEELLNFKKLQHPSADGLNTFINQFSISVTAFERLDIKDKLNFIYLHLGLKKVDYETGQLFEHSVRGESIPSYDTFVTFVKEQARILERGGPRPVAVASIKSASNTSKAPVPKPAPAKQSRSFVTSTSSSSEGSCPLCGNAGHNNYLSKCTEFLKLSAKDRYNIVKKYNGCVNCLSLQHKASGCTAKVGCSTCLAKSHNTLLHFNNNTKSSTAMAVSQDCAEVCTRSDDPAGTDMPLPIVENGSGAAAGVSLCSMQNAKTHSSSQGIRHTTVLLATARVKVIDPRGVSHMVRCLVDCGAQNEFITVQCCERLSLRSKRPDVPVSVYGFGGGINHVEGVTELVFSSRFDNDQQYKIKPLVVNQITNNLPTAPVDESVMSYLSSVPLADDTFRVNGEIEMLIGASLFARLLLPGRIRGPLHMPDAIQTTLGFLVMGECPIMNTSKRSVALCALTENPMQDLVSKFWQLEEVPSCTAARLSIEDQECERFYRTTTTRDPSGRYAVALPFKSDPNQLGSSLHIAEKRFLTLERKLQSSSLLRNSYDSIIKEYLEIGYLSPVEDTVDEGYVIPHHGVVRNDKVSTKLRMVLDASARTDTGWSLNQLLHAGPNLQGDIFLILLNFRLLPVAFCADVKQMYLQIKVHPQYSKYLRLLYRFNPNDELQMFEFDRVAFGLTVSPFLALRTVRQLCDDERSKFPSAARVVERDLYMDDVATSEMSVSAAAETVKQLIGMFKAGGFDLMKWSSNSTDLLSQIPDTHLHPQAVNFDDNVSQKILGVKWEPKSDTFSFDVAFCPDKCTKRNVLSVVARLWDVLGLVAPVILYAKLLIQELWELKIDWDELPPTNFVARWTRFKEELSLLTALQIPRHSGVVQHCVVSLVAFSDASLKGFGAVVYLHCQTANGIVVNLLCAKSRVAPLKTVSLARLELCAALLLSQLVRGVLDNYQNRIKMDRILAFSDSTVTLHWIHSSPHKWKTFVANRIAKIQSNLDASHFYHIAGKENPSDCLSRGLTPSQLLEHPMWFKGPPWLQQDSAQWPVIPFRVDTQCEIPEIKIVALPAAQPEAPVLYTLAQRVSSWVKLLRIVVYVLRFARKLRSQGYPDAEDIAQAELAIIRTLQKVHFAEAIHIVESGNVCSKSIQKLRPILIDGILRVGGRLEKADLTFDHKHPILLPGKDHIVDLLIDHFHRKNCHTGPHLLLSLIRQRYWILAGRNIVRARVHACNVCFRARPKAYQPPVMADLPECRLQIAKPFTHTGVDYCGPINISLSRGRGIRSQKAYICVFVCLTTRAVHVEIAPDLSTDAFLNAFKRFIARRGPVERLFSDNGTNFVGARAYLKELYEFLDSEAYKRIWQDELASRRITWQMIPPSAPHFGGSWESNVRSFKLHLIRVIGAQILTYEELLTVLTQIEAVLNSRPLGQALSPDPAEPVALTPAHFLHTTPLSSLPSAPVSEDIKRLRSRFLLLDKLVQSYWSRWSIEYLHTLQTREKWLTDSKPIEKGTVVLIMQPNHTSPLHWPLGVIQETYPGTDRRTRVVLVKTKHGTIKRPVVRLCPLPTQ